MSEKLLPSQNKLPLIAEAEPQENGERSGLQLTKINNNSEIFASLERDLKPDNSEATAEIWQAVLLEEEPQQKQKPSRRDRPRELIAQKTLTPLGISGAILFVSANILVGISSVAKIPDKTIITPQPAAETTIANVPNLAAEKLVKLNWQTIITTKVKTPAEISNQSAASKEIEVIPGAYADLSASLLPPSLRPLRKSYTVEAIASE